MHSRNMLARLGISRYFSSFVIILFVALALSLFFFSFLTLWTSARGVIYRVSFQFVIYFRFFLFLLFGLRARRPGVRGLEKMAFSSLSLSLNALAHNYNSISSFSFFVFHFFSLSISRTFVTFFCFFLKKT